MADDGLALKLTRDEESSVASPQYIRSETTQECADNADATIQIAGIAYERTRFGMLRQIDPLPFTYDNAYLKSQSTTVEMSYLRLGYLLAHVPFETLRSSRSLELGPGKGVFFDILKSHVGSLEGHDAASDSPYNTIAWDQAVTEKWDLVLAFDVLEHFADINRIWELDFDYGFFSIPSPPAEGVHAGWRHFKPNEHIWHVTAEQFRRWSETNGYEVLACDSPEDFIRKRWDQDQPNINSFIVRRFGMQ